MTDEVGRMDGMGDLAEFLLARIAEEEIVARSVQEVNPKSDSDVFTSLSEPTGTVEMAPRRFLAKCEADRLIVARHAVLDEGAYCYEDGSRSPCPTLRLLALPYADHEDYRSEWSA